MIVSEQDEHIEGMGVGCVLGWGWGVCWDGGRVCGAKGMPRVKQFTLHEQGYT